MVFFKRTSYSPLRRSQIHITCSGLKLSFLSKLQLLLLAFTLVVIINAINLSSRNSLFSIFLVRFHERLKCPEFINRLTAFQTELIENYYANIVLDFRVKSSQVKSRAIYLYITTRRLRK